MLDYRCSRMLSLPFAILVATTAAPALATASSPVPSATFGWTYLAFGDSNVYGPAEACGDCTTYPHLLAERITDELGVPVRLLDGSQWNRLSSSRLLAEIQEDARGEAYETPRDPR